MKTTFLPLMIAILITAISCNNKSENDTQGSQTETNSTDDKKQPKAVSANIPSDMQNILGEWTLVRKLRDDNGNGKIDGEEEKTAITDTEYYLKLNADGTCKFETVMDGRYEIITAEDGRKRLDIHDMAGTKYPFQLYILSVSENELVINSVLGGSGFDIYKRA
jgi:hypothetical protein